MNKLLLASLLACLSFTEVSAEGDNFICSGTSIEDTDNIISSVQDSYSTVNNFKAVFTQDSYLASMQISETSTGNVEFKKPGMMRWDYHEPEPQLFLLKKQTVWFYQELDSQVLITSASGILISELPLSFMMGIGDLKQDFSILSICHDKNKASYIIKMNPVKVNMDKDGNKELASLVLKVDKKTNFPSGARVEDIAGNITTINFKNIKINPGIDDDVFVAEFPPGTDVIDKRKLMG